MEMSQVLLILQLFVDSNKSLYFVASRGYSCFFFMLCFYMLFPLTSRQKCLCKYREGKKSLDLWRTVMILRMLEGVMLDTSICIKVHVGFC